MFAPAHQPMNLWPKLVRIAALLLLFSAATDLVARDLLGPLWETQLGPLGDPCPNDGVQPDGFCCNTHIIVTTPQVQWAPVMLIVVQEEPAAPAVLSTPLTPPYHPPRA
jgi:hypothetical protein